MALITKGIEVILMRERWNPFSASLHTEPASTPFDFMSFLANKTQAHSNMRGERKGQNHKFLTLLGESRHHTQIPVTNGCYTSWQCRQCKRAPAMTSFITCAKMLFTYCLLHGVPAKWDVNGSVDKQVKCQHPQWYVVNSKGTRYYRIV